MLLKARCKSLRLKTIHANEIINSTLQSKYFPLPVLKLVLYFNNIASISETSSVILQLLQKPYDHNMNIVHIYDTVV